ncbi:ABC transporter permease [Mucilaginibacter auburnensis]|uniref:Putative ABC transport system permease protein n=1 Tax=Mucilaginibacter auburnensis TaxID=1457233 RepID=A0A2H9VMD5_9SPHI|nr:ABC transporter permease [Mucilaginibacter auburnensis]PJJ79476.1 putative ABC transport system permease protein [Mucilaginibacter auburnensis]
MLQNYITVAWRNMWKHKFFTLINIFGLSIGICFTLVIAVYVWQESSVNSQLRNADNQYIIQSKWKKPGLGYEMTTLAGLPQALKQNYPNLVANAYHWDGINSIVSKGDKHFQEILQVGDSSFINMYGFKLLDGDGATALKDPFSVVITEEKAIKYFGKTNCVGQTLTIESFKGEKHDFTVTGVLAKYRKNSVTNLIERSNSTFFLPAEAVKFLGRDLDSWSNVVVVGLLELKEGIKPADLVGPMKTLIKVNATPQIAANLDPYLINLQSYYQDNPVVKKTIFTLSCIALFILLMAVVNFVNICISSSSKRMKEMGVRKVLGGLRQQLIIQFLTESVLMVAIATLLSPGIYALSKPFFADLLSTEMTGILSLPYYFYLGLIAFALVIGILAGLYPALMLSSLKSVDSLKGKRDRVKDNVLFRKVLIGFQFSTAAVALIAAIVISAQIDLFFGKNLGFDKDYLIYAALPRDWSKTGVQKMERVRSELSQLPQVKSATLSWEIPDGGAVGYLQTYKFGADERQSFATTLMIADNQYANTYNIPLKAGEFFKKDYIQSDSALVVINEAQSKALGFKSPKEAIGRQFNAQYNPTFTICGVVANFQFGPMTGPVTPLMFMNVNQNNLYRYFSIKLRPGNTQADLAALQAKWTELMPGAPFEYNFMDDALAKIYRTEIQLKKASYLATGLAIVIVLLGLLGLISLSIQKRTREIGIRKVLGSSINGIVMLFLKDFVVVIAIAGLVACPLAYWMMNSWLNDYAYKTPLNVMPFGASLFSLLVVASVLITAQTIKAALANPVQSLRTE